jgi:hypothetical protein
MTKPHRFTAGRNRVERVGGELNAGGREFYATKAVLPCS